MCAPMFASEESQTPSKVDAGVRVCPMPAKLVEEDHLEVLCQAIALSNWPVIVTGTVEALYDLHLL